jgi:hypothetical protein
MSIDQVKRYDAQAKRDGINAILDAFIVEELTEGDRQPFQLDSTYLAGPAFDLPATPNPKGGSK